MTRSAGAPPAPDPHIDPRRCDERALARHLLTALGLQWAAAAWDRDPYALLLRAQRRDPAPTYRRLWDLPDLHRSPAGGWVTGRRSLGARLLADPRFDPRPADHPGLARLDDLGRAVQPLCLAPEALERDAAGYARLAALAEPALGPEAVRQWLPAVRDAFAAAGHPAAGDRDLVTDVARPGVVAAVAALLGLDASERRRLAGWHAAGGGVLDASLCPPRTGAVPGLVALVDGARQLGARVAAEPADPADPAGAPPAHRLLRAAGERATGERATGERATDEGAAADVAALVVLLCTAGVELATNLSCRAVARLAAEPARWRGAGADPAAARAAVAEVARLEPPVRIERLFALERLTVAGVSLEAGEQVLVLTEAAGRDPGAHAAPEVFDPDRQGAPSLGAPLAGPLTRLLTPLASLCAEVAVAELARRFPRLHGRAPALIRPRSPVTRGLLRLPVRLV